MKKTEREWRKIVLLAHYKRLSSIPKLQDEQKKILQKVTNILKEEYLLSEEDLSKELQQYKTEVLPNRENVIRQKSSELFGDIVTELKKMKTDESLSTHDNPEIRNRLEEIIAMGGGQILEEEERKVNVSHTMFYQTNISGDDLGGHTYYFSFDK